jgi:hypothetical protein
MSPFLDMFSISSTFVKPLHLQAIIGGNFGGDLETSLKRTGRIYDIIHAPDHLHSDDSDVTAS